jgi:hypothetical protein
MHPSQVLSIKQRVLRTDTTRWAAHLGAMLEADDPQAACATVHRVLANAPSVTLDSLTDLNSC